MPENRPRGVQVSVTMKCSVCQQEGKILLLHPDGSVYCVSCLTGRAKAKDGDTFRVAGLIGNWFEDLGHQVTPDMLDS